MERYKACLVGKGFTQKEQLDYHETFAPFSKLITIHCLLALVTTQNWSLFQMDVNNVLYDDMHKVYMIPLPELC